MSLSSTLKQFVEQLMISARIISPRFTDYQIERLDYYSEGAEGFEEILKQEVERIMDEHQYKKPPRNKKEFRLKENQAASMVKQTMAIAQNPAGIVGVGIGFMPHATLVLLAIALAPLIVQELKKPGSMLDIRWKRIMQDEFNAFLQRQDQWDTKLGLRIPRVQSASGFLVTNGSAMTENSLRQVREGGTDGNRLALIDMTDHTKELFGP